MRTLEQHLTNYASYHRDRRNIATHFFGIPMIVLAVGILLGRPSVGYFAPVQLVALFAAVFYLRLDLRFGAMMTAIMAANTAAGMWFAAQSTSLWLGAGLGLFVGGWAIQFFGHYFEGKKPAFVDDLVGLLVGPLFITAEIAFALGLRLEVKEAIEAKAGPTIIRDMSRAVRS